MMNNQLKVFYLESDGDIALYKKYLKQIDVHNPFLRFELLQVDDIDAGKLYYFLYCIENVPSILMTFILRPVQNTHYFDVTSPYGYNGPVFKDALPSHEIENYWKEVDQWYRKNNVISEFIRFGLNDNYINYSGTVVHTLNNVRGNIIDKESQWENFKPKVRNNYRKAAKNNLEFRMYHTNIDDDILDQFHYIYTSTMKRNEASNQYYYPRSYFSQYVANNPKRCAIAMVFHEGKAISTELVLLDKKIVYSFLGGTISEFFSLRPNDFLKIKVMDWAREHKYKSYVLGGGRKDGDSLYSYKKSFFSNDEDIVYHTGRKVLEPNVYRKLAKINEGTAIINEGFFPAYRSDED